MPSCQTLSPLLCALHTEIDLCHRNSNNSRENQRNTFSSPLNWPILFFPLLLNNGYCIFSYCSNVKGPISHNSWRLGIYGFMDKREMNLGKYVL